MKMSNTKKYINIYTKAFLVLLLASFVILGSSATELHAQTDVQDCTEFANDPGALDECLQAVEEGNRQTSEIIDINDINIPTTQANDTTIQNVLELVFAIIGGLSVLMVIIGGVRYIISTGDPQKTATAKNTIIYAVVGLIISVSAYVIVWFIFRVIEGSPTSGGVQQLIQDYYG